MVVVVAVTVAVVVGLAVHKVHKVHNLVTGTVQDMDTTVSVYLVHLHYTSKEPICCC